MKDKLKYVRKMVVILKTENWLIFQCNAFIDSQMGLKIGKDFLEDNLA